MLGVVSALSTQVVVVDRVVGIHRVGWGAPSSTQVVVNIGGGGRCWWVVLGVMSPSSMQAVVVDIGGLRWGGVCVIKM